MPTTRVDPSGSVEITLVGGLYLVHWIGADSAAIPFLIDDVRKLAKARLGPLFYVAVYDDDAPRQSPGLRRQVVQWFRELVSIVDHVYIVVTAQGFRASRIRSKLASLALIVGGENATVTTSFDALLDAEQDRLGMSRRAVRRELEALGFVAPGTIPSIAP
ncbi:MAG: hypothetical protein AAF447_03910 [Myxococcota bacterium]